VKNLQATEPLDGTSTGTARKTVKNQCPERTETPHLRSTIKLNSKERKAQLDAKISFSLNSIKNPYNHGGLRPPSLF
jgi:hypothetical protein